MPRLKIESNYCEERLKKVAAAKPEQPGWASKQHYRKLTRGPMSEESERFRTRAHQCRELAKLAFPQQPIQSGAPPTAR